ncbi:sensor histidine kinase [Desulfovibrio desulfuricans]|uniref:sensor histidine kinase n=1 Tax=Desulfovibrio desulfuricans TaxID=876 RepID=UPI0035B1AA13
MLPHFFVWHTIRGKIAIGTGLFLAMLLLLGGIACYDLGRIDRAARLIDMVDDLRSDVLEMRRYEKNLQLFPGRQGDLAALRSFVELARERATSVGQGYNAAMGRRVGDGAHRNLDLLLEGIGTYEALLEDAPSDGAALTDQGQRLSELADSAVRRMRQGIFTAVGDLRTQLLGAIAALLACGVAFAWQIGRHIMRALGAIENAARSVGAGMPLPSPPPQLEAEAHHVLQTLDGMATELEKRHSLLLQEKKLASLGVLTSGVAHQLNNPLNNISMGCQLLGEDVNDARQGVRPMPTADDVTAQLNEIQAEVVRARDIVCGLLDFARDRPFSVALHDLGGVVRRAVALVRHDMGTAVRIEVDVPEGLRLPMDAQRMQEVLINLLLNAAQAMNGEGLVRITARADEPASMVELCVSDSGKGIEAQYLGRIFDPFFSLKPVGEGTGLGLSIAFGIVGKHSGTLEVQSKPGEGACFTVRLPLAARQAADVSGADV